MFLQIQTIDGQFFGSDPADFTVQDIDAVHALLEDFASMDHLRLTIGGKVKYFNPRNILWAEIVL